MTSGTKGIARFQESADNWFVRHVAVLKSVLRITFGIVWGIDGLFKFQPGFADTIVGQISDAANGQPGWLQPWFAFWSQTVAADPAFFAYSIGLFELALGVALVAGFLRKIAYTGGFFLSLIIWSVPEGFGGPYGPSSTDIGTGIIYAFVFVFLMILAATYGPSLWSVDAWIERRWGGWRRIAEFRGEPAASTASTQSL